jgi:hypothetical protein
MMLARFVDGFVGRIARECRLFIDFKMLCFDVAETEGFEPSIELCNPITV